jgi:NAD(P)H-flavin reductase
LLVGPNSILVNAGSDATDEFLSIHSEHARNLIKSFRIARLSPTASEEAQNQPQYTELNHPKKALDPRKYLPFHLVHREVLTRDTRLLRFALPFPDQVTGIEPGQHLMIRIQASPSPVKSSGECSPNSAEKGSIPAASSKFVIRAYTPTTLSQTTQGHFDLIIRVYPAPYGRCSRALDSLKLNDLVYAKGPLGEIVYKGLGLFCVPKLDESHKKSGDRHKSIAVESMKREIQSLGGKVFAMENEDTDVDLERTLARIESSDSISSLDGHTSEDADQNVIITQSEDAPCYSPWQTHTHVSHIFLIAAGTGITPCWQIIQAIYHEWTAYNTEIAPKSQQRKPPPHVSLVYANKTLTDILLLKELHEVFKDSSRSCCSWFQLTHALSREKLEVRGRMEEFGFPPGVAVVFGRVNMDALKVGLGGSEVENLGCCEAREKSEHDMGNEAESNVESDDEDIVEMKVPQIHVDDDHEHGKAAADCLQYEGVPCAFVCGNDAFAQKTCRPALEALGYKSSRIFMF